MVNIIKSYIAKQYFTFSPQQEQYHEVRDDKQDQAHHSQHQELLILESHLNSCSC